MLIRPLGLAGSITSRQVNPGDLVADGRSVTPGAITTVGAGTWTGAAIASGIITRTGPAGGYTDTTDTAQNIINALVGNDPNLDVMPGIAFSLLFLNTVAFAHTFATGAGVTAGNNVNTAASLVREYLVTILNATPQVVVSCGTTNASLLVTIDSAASVGSAGNPGGLAAGTITPGMIVSGTGITAGTLVAGVTYGSQTLRALMDRIVGVTLNANATATNASGIALSFFPNVRFDGLRSATA